MEAETTTEEVTEESTETVTEEPEVSTETTPPAALVAEDGTFTEGWIDQLGDEFEDARPTLSKYQNFPAMAKSHFELQKMLGGQAGKVAPLTPESTPEEVAKYRKTFGIPEEPAGYDLKAPESMPEGMQWDQARADAYAEVMHKNNASPALAQELMALKVQEEAERLEQGNAAYESHVAEGAKALKAEWGADYDKNLALAKRGAATLDLDPKGAFFNDPAIVKAMAKMASLVSDAKLVTGHENPDLMDNKTRAQDIMNNPQNPYYQRYYDGDEKVNSMVQGLLKG